MQSLVGRRGEWFFTSRSFALATSDFNEVQRIRVMNAAASAARTAIADYVGDDVELKTDGTGRIAEAETNGPVTIGDVRVHPGDCVIADASGVVFVPAAQLDRVLQAAEAIAGREAAMTQALRAGRPISEVMGADYEHMLR